MRQTRILSPLVLVTCALAASIPKKPGGKLGKWFSWSGAKTICKRPY